jgi:hypothetical protein
MSTALTILTIVVLAAWFVLSALSQIPKIAPALRRFDPASLIPNWSFFAPKPVSFDYHLLYRDELWDLTLTDWTEIPLVEERPWWCFVWNPKRRAKKALFDACSMLLRIAKNQLPSGTTLPPSFHRSVPYLILLNYISSLPHPTARGSQFLVLRTYGPDARPAPTVAFMSQFHSVDEAELSDGIRSLVPDSAPAR